MNDIVDAPWFTITENTTVDCKVIDVYDGDTITIIFPFCNNNLQKCFKKTPKTAHTINQSTVRKTHENNCFSD